MLFKKKQTGGNSSAGNGNGQQDDTQQAPPALLISVDWTPDAFGPPNYNDDGTLRDEVLAEGGFKLTSVQRTGDVEIFDAHTDNYDFALAIANFLKAHEQAVRNASVIV